MTTQIHYYHGTGKRKRAIAQVRLYLQPGSIQINNQPLEERFPWPTWRELIIQPLRVTDSLNRYTIQVKVLGGGVAGQAGAIRHGIARALQALDPNLTTTLRRHHLLTRDARIKERKKVGLIRARKRKQYSKR